MTDQRSDLTRITPPRELTEAQRLDVFNHLYRRLAGHRSKAEFYAQREFDVSSKPTALKIERRDAHVKELNRWAIALLENAWAACEQPSAETCPTLDPLSDTSTAGLPALPDQAHVDKLLTTIIFLHLTTTNAYHAHTRAFLSTFGSLDEGAVIATLKDPERAVQEAEKKTQSAKELHAGRDKTLRRVGMGLAAIGGGVLVGVTGGLAAPLVGAGVTTVLGFLGVGGTAAGLLAGGLASSSVVCGALFGAYGSNKSAQMVGRYTQEVRDLSIVPVHKPTETLAVRFCVSGWLDGPEDVTAPWSIFSGDDTFALRWEVEALMRLSNALGTLIKTQTLQYVGAKIIQQTVLASLFSALSPMAWLKIGQIIDNPWMTAKALACKAGRVLGTLIAQRVLGNRPMTLVGYSLGSLVIFEALQYLASLPSADTASLIQDVYLFGAPVPVEESEWSAVRRVVSGRLVNGYSTADYVLAVLARVSGANWAVSGLQEVPVAGVENVECTEVDGHLKWRTMVGRSLQLCGAPGILESEVKLQQEIQQRFEQEMQMSKNGARETVEPSAVDDTT